LNGEWIPKISRQHFFLRTAALEEDGKKQIFYPKSNDGWLKTIFVMEGRAIDRFLVPWIIVSANAVIWTVFTEEVLSERIEVEFSTYENFFSVVLNTSLAFLLVFRLNRSAERFWDARSSWGIILAFCRSMVGDILVHANHDPTNRDAVIRWVAAFAVSSMHFIRGIPEIIPETLLGILDIEEIEAMEKAPHPPLYVADQLRFFLKEAFRIDIDTPFGLAHEKIQHLHAQDLLLNGLVLHVGALERIRATPLPLVYVSHLRTFLLCFLLSIPYIWVRTLGYATIPLVCMTGYALLGLEGAAQEVESPFQKNRPNHLSMDAYCLTLIGNITQQIRQSADREIRFKKGS
jgi:putative membrane protein